MADSMSSDPTPRPAVTPRRRQRRKDARPSEIIEAAIEVFGERGFGKARLEDVARKAGVAKGTVFVYFATKEDLFRAVAQTVLSAHLRRLQGAAADIDRPLTETVPALLAQTARVIGEGRLPAMMRLLIAESRTFPDLARVWHDEVVSKMLGLVTGALERAQARGEIRPGDVQLQAISIMGPMLAAALFREVFRDTAPLPDLQELAAQHAQTVLRGLLAPDKA
jgi:AcrR family transcriptional regulator